ncbi:hypothetical protein SD78_0873 [Bacillus badius]|nr:hypothetical protein SD78_0873 [Bacillus badius]
MREANIQAACGSGCRQGESEMKTILQAKKPLKARCTLF